MPSAGVEIKGTSERGYERLILTEMLGCATDPQGAGAQVFVVDLCDEGSRLHPHFHTVDQYQLTIRGTGTLGKSELVPGTLHYADAYQPYGPIVAGPEGLAFMTIRATHDSGSHRMPGSGHLRKERPERPEVVTTIDLHEQSVGPVVGPFDDGLEIGRIAVEPGGDYPLGAGAAPMIAVVLDGEIQIDQARHGRWAAAHVPAGERLTISAGDDGAQLLVLRFPARSAA
jgi:hypothetical protein